MGKSRKSEPDEIELIAWAIPQIAQGHYVMRDDVGGRELRVLERPLNLEEIEGSLLRGHSDAVASAMSQMRDHCSFVNAQNFLIAIFGKKLGTLLAQQFVGKPLEYDFVILAAYAQEESLRQNLPRIFVQGREGLSTSQHEQMESRVIPEAISNAVVTYYAREVANLFPRMIRRADQLRVLAAEESVPINVQTYLEEASKCYIYGRFTACLIVCRSAIEFALRERLNNLAMKSPRTLRPNVSDGLFEMIRLARKVFPPNLKKTLDAADCVRLRAKDAVHKGPQKPEVCKEMFDATRGVLRELYFDALG